MNSFWERGDFKENFAETQGIPRLWNLSSQVGTDRFWLLNIQARHQPIELLPGQVSGFLSTSWPVISSFYTKALVDKDEPCSVIHQCFDSILSPSAKKKQSVRFRILTDNLLNNGAQTIDRLPHVCCAALSKFQDKQAYPHKNFILIFLSIH